MARGDQTDAGKRRASRGRQRAGATRATDEEEPGLERRGVEPGGDAALSAGLDSEGNEEPVAGERESDAGPPSAFGVGRADFREELETDGPVLGGPGMIRMGADRAVSSGTGGLAAGEDLDPVAEGDYWRENFRRSPYSASETETDYEPAYRFGWKKAGQSEYRNRGFEEVELDLREQWEGGPDANQSWEQAREAAHDAFESARRNEE